MTKLTHNDLVSIFSMLLMENDFYVACKKKDYAAIPEEKRTYFFDDRKEVCYEDKLADCLLNGYTLEVVDIQADWIVNDDILPNIKHKKNRDEYHSVSYFVNLQDFLDGVNREGALQYLADLKKENDDYWTAYNLIQFVIFGDNLYA